MNRQIRQMHWIILMVGLFALFCGTLMSIWAAGRITHPLRNLVDSTQEAVKGNLTSEIPVRGGDEVGVLAGNFSAMVREILAHREQLETRLIEIKRLQRYMEKLLTTMNDGLLSVDMTGTVSTINPSAQRMLDQAGRAVEAGQLVSELSGHYTDLVSYIFDSIKNPCDRKHQEIRLNSAEHKQIFLVGSSILRNRDGNPQEIIFNFHDVTELKKLEASMRQTERLAALGTLAAGMAHEIRNPLSAIKTFVQLLPRKLEKPGFLEKFYRTVPRELNRINQLVEDLLDLARIPKYQFGIFDIRQVITQTIEFIGEELQTHNIRCHCKIPDRLPLVRADVNQLSKAFNNLIRNAIQAMPDGGDLSIRAILNDQNPGDLSASGNTLTLMFQDTGNGISPEEIKQIFNPFFTTKVKGTGLGLAITHKVVTEHGGRIEVESRPGRGACFTVDLPVDDSPS
jgi:two-component system sensor histidine kinase AtoS